MYLQIASVGELHNDANGLAGLVIKGFLVADDVRIVD